MKRIKARTDTNQQQIVKALRDKGCSVQSLHQLGKGIPDLLVGYGGNNYLLELKDGSKPPSKQRLTDDETKWQSQWQGQVTVVNSIETAIAVVLDTSGLERDRYHSLYKRR
jgi:hypothetical protein